MAQIVLIHGIGQQASTAGEQEAAWLPSLVKGVLASGTRMRRPWPRGWRPRPIKTARP